MRKFMPYVCFNTDDPAGATPPAAPAAVAPPAPVAPPPPAPAGDGPWAQDLASLFPDAEVRGQVDQFLRSKVQPHVTQVEQEYAPARELWNDLQADDTSESIGTYIAVAEQLYGPEVARAVAESFQAQAAAQTPAPAEPPQAQLTPEQQRSIEWAQAQEAEQLYQSELARATEAAPKDANGNSIVREDLFRPFVVSTEGDFDLALGAYQQWYATAYPAAPAEPTPPPPATLDGDAAAATIPQTVPGKATLDSAIDDTLAEMRAARAPATVGQV